MHLLNRLTQQVQTLQVNRWHDVEGTGQNLRALDPKVKPKVPSTAALVFYCFSFIL